MTLNQPDAFDVDTPVGSLRVTVDAAHVVGLTWRSTDTPPDAAHGAAVSEPVHTISKPQSPVAKQAYDQITAYFAGTRTAFDLPLLPNGTRFQKAVWTVLSAIPFGETRTYAAVANAVGSHPRAVANACGANPIPILIPCHRVTGSNGDFGGFSGGRGPATKRVLLDLEGLGLPLFQSS